MFEKWYSVIFITLLPPFPLVKGRAVSRIIKQEIKRVKLT
jgi:hypothetical protein